MEENVTVGESCSVKEKGIVYTGIVISSGECNMPDL